eukprot:gb/GFBE01009283.1/.p1 GENE.gb/GFBE01009283.1/~~gb/GFBE01009283.1/.p1  ORF type:complete len:688 (+),score=135.27 gb/GFBE01009283.1/:1-2064(+)
MFDQRYERLRVLGEGAFGTAHLVREKAHPRSHYVAKEIRMSHLGTKERDLAIAESQVLRRISHANIIGYVNSFLEGPRLFIVMEYADGGDLATQIKLRKDANGSFRETEIMSFHVQLVLALSHIHGHKILHRDLKPLNIFLTKQLIVKLGDFGISKVLESTTAGAQTTIGTPLYLAPEICNGEAYGVKSDLWSLGVVTYELAALQVPFQAPSMMNLVVKVCNAEAAPIPSRYSSQLSGIVTGLLQKQPRKRVALVELLRSPFVRQHMESLLSWSRDHAVAKVDSSPGSDRTPQKVAAPSHPLAPASPSPRQLPDAAEAARAEFFRNRQAALEAKQRCRGVSPSIQPTSYVLGGGPQDFASEKRRAEATPPPAGTREDKTRLPNYQALNEESPGEDRREAVRRKSQLERESRDAARVQELEDARREAFQDRLAAKQRKEQLRRSSLDAAEAPSSAASPTRSAGSTESVVSSDGDETRKPVDPSSHANYFQDEEASSALPQSHDMEDLQKLLSAALQSPSTEAEDPSMEQTLLPTGVEGSLAEQTLRPELAADLVPSSVSADAASAADDRPIRPADPMVLPVIMEGTQDSLIYTLESGFNSTLGSQLKDELAEQQKAELPADSQLVAVVEVPTEPPAPKAVTQPEQPIPHNASSSITLHLSSEADSPSRLPQSPQPDDSSPQKSCCEIM